ncbi:MAG: hypothetical protein Q9170_006022 [Blastenia crenularia]
MTTPDPHRQPSGVNQHQPKYRRRQRVINSCFECRKRKMRCSKTYPCYNCSRFSRNCVFIAFHDPEVRASMQGAKSDGSNEDDDVRLYFPQAQTGGASPATGSGHTPEPDPEQMFDSLYDADAEDDLMDLGLQIGRLCISERIGGLFRPGFGEMLDDLLAQKDGHLPDRPAAGYSGNIAAPIQDIPILPEPSSDLLLPFSQPTTIIPIYSILTSTELDTLYHQYFKAVDPLAHVVHKPTFDRQFCRVFLGQGQMMTATKSFTALILSMGFAAAVSLTQSQCQVQLQSTKVALVEKLKSAAEKALVTAQHMKSLKLETLQAFTIYLVPQVGGQISRAQSSLVGALIRLALCAGLHHDASSSDTSPLECHIRGLLWHQICFLDLHTAEAQGPQPMIHDSDYDTPLPLNVDDLAFERFTSPPPSDGWTDTTFSLMRYEINDIHKLIFRERIALSKRTKDLPTVQAQVESRIQAIVQKYLDKFDDRIPLQRCAKLAGTSLLSRCLPMLLQIYLKFDDKSEAQYDIQSAVLARSLDMMEASATLETATDLVPWAWFAPTYQQYHGILLPLVWLYLDPNMPQAARASAMIDHVFGTCYGIARQQRCADILRMLASECTAFMKLRKVKHMSAGSSRSSEASPPNIEAAFEDFRQSQQQVDHNQASAGVGKQANMDQQSLEDLVAGFGETPMTMDEWWSMPDQLDFTDPLFNFQEGA